MSKSPVSFDIIGNLVRVTKSNEIFDGLTTEQRDTILAKPQNYPVAFIHSMREGKLRPGIVLSWQFGRLMVLVAKEG